MDLTALVVPVAGALGVLAWRLREARRPVSARSIVLPPVMMSTGLAMFGVPQFRVPMIWAAAALLVGATVLAQPLVRATRLERDARHVRMRASRGFVFVLIALALARLLLRDSIDGLVSPAQTASLFYLMAFGMIVRWRLGMWRRYRALHR
jgi:membrane protein CcdC involved in cytochrome C biogenesis